MNPVRATSQTPKGGRPRGAADATRPRRRGDRMSFLPQAVLEAADAALRPTWMFRKPHFG